MLLENRSFQSEHASLVIIVIITSLCELCHRKKERGDNNPLHDPASTDVKLAIIGLFYKDQSAPFSPRARVI